VPLCVRLLCWKEVRHECFLPQMLKMDSSQGHCQTVHNQQVGCAAETSVTDSPTHLQVPPSIFWLSGSSLEVLLKGSFFFLAWWPDLPTILGCQIIIPRPPCLGGATYHNQAHYHKIKIHMIWYVSFYQIGLSSTSDNIQCCNRCN